MRTSIAVIKLVLRTNKTLSTGEHPIMNEIQKPDVNLLRLATITGKSLTTIHQYLKLLDDVDLV